MVPREIEDNGYAIFFVEWGGEKGGWTNKVYNSLDENGQLIVFNSVLFYHLLCLVNGANRPFWKITNNLI